MARPETFRLELVMGLEGREKIEWTAIQDLVHGWAASNGLLPYLGNPFVDMVFAGCPRVPLGYRGWIDGDAVGTFEGEDVTYVVSVATDELVVVAISKHLFGRSLRVQSDVATLSSLLDEYNQREGLIRAGARTMGDVDALSPTEFEAFVAQLFKRDGWSVEMTRAAGDCGVDVLVEKNGTRAVVQCKKWSRNVGQPVLRDVYGSMLHANADCAFVVTTGYFTREADAFSVGKPIELLDRHCLAGWMGAQSQGTEAEEPDSDQPPRDQSTSGVG